MLAGRAAPLLDLTCLDSLRAWIAIPVRISMMLTETNLLPNKPSIDSTLFITLEQQKLLGPAGTWDQRDV